jgi:hypothetical protein
MDSTELTQLIVVCAIALAALVAAPIVAFLAEAQDRKSEREHPRPWATPRFA